MLLEQQSILRGFLCSHSRARSSRLPQETAAACGGYGRASPIHQVSDETVTCVHGPERSRCWKPRLPRGMETEVLTQIWSRVRNGKVPSPDNVPWSKWKGTKAMNDTGEKEAACSPPVIRERSKLQSAASHSEWTWIKSDCTTATEKESIKTKYLRLLKSSPKNLSTRIPWKHLWFFFNLKYIFNSK